MPARRKKGQTDEKVYDSAPPQPDDAFWLEQGRKMVAESLPSLRNAAAQLITGIWALEGIYLGLLGFADLVPPSAPVSIKVLFLAPLLLWMIALLGSVQVVKTRAIQFNWHAPEEIQRVNERLLQEKQRYLNLAVASFTAGMLVAFVLVLFVMYLG